MAFIEDLIMKQLSNNIRERRFKSGEMTQKALAERVGISRQTMNAIENCRHAPTVSVAIRIADVFTVTVDQLFSLDYEGKPERHEPTARTAIGRRPPIIKEPIEIERKSMPFQEKAECQLSVADLRGLIDS